MSTAMPGTEPKPPMIPSGDTRMPELIVTGQIVAAYLSHHAVNMGEVPGFITSVYGAVSTLGQPAAPAPEPEPLVPAVPIKKSITDDFIVCLDDGKKFRSLKRHLATLGMTPDEYRTKWGLPADYPMASPSYSIARSALAKKTGLGTKAVSHR